MDIVRVASCSIWNASRAKIEDKFQVDSLPLAFNQTVVAKPSNLEKV
jgi:hypothetical protein